MKEGRAGGTSVPERVSQAFYTHGVFCSAHPIAVLTLAVLLVLLSCIPLYWLPVPSNVPQLFTQGDNNTSTDVPPLWFSTSPPIYIQQVIVKSVVSPWVSGLSPVDAIRAPLAQAFSLVETIENYQLPSGKSLVDVCTQVEEPNDYIGTLPQYSCLSVSPSNLWRRNQQTFYSDPDLVTTIYKHNDAQLGKVSLAEVLFGLRLKESGIKRYPLRNRQRVIQFSITVFLNELDTQYLEGLKQRLSDLYPSETLGSPTVSPPSADSVRKMVHVYYAGDFEYRDFLPLLLTYIILFFYMYFSVRKIELVRSKVGMALSAVFTVIASLLMSVGLCLMFGLDPSSSSRGREVFPYLVIVVGLENILVLTKSVVSTAPHLDAKIRIAQGLAREGWSITKNLLTEVTILTCGLFTLVPAIQEFCMFAVVGLLCDFFLQMCFFATVLSLDIRGLETGGGGGYMKGRSRQPAVTPPLPTPRHEPRPRSSAQSKPITSNIPKRLRIVYFWARTRIVQRMFMLCMVVWIGGFLYSADLIQRIVTLHQPGKVDVAGGSRVQGPVSSTYLGHSSHLLQANFNHSTKNIKEEGVVWGQWSRGLAPPMWCYLVAEYNTSGCRLAVLPPIRIKSIVSPGAAARLTSPADPPPAPPWNPIANALDPIEYPQDEVVSSDVEGWGEVPLYPSTPLELLLVTLLTTISLVVIGYTALALYHCVCSRNYAQWRGSWGTTDAHQSDTQVIEAMPIVLDAHSQAVEWVASDGSTVASCCLAGEINIWDASSGELITHIDRNRFLDGQGKTLISVDESDQMMSDYESGSPPPAQNSFMFNRHGGEARRPSLDGRPPPSDAAVQLADYSRLISTDFTRVCNRCQPTRRTHGFDYALSLHLYRQERSEEICRYEEEDLGSLDSLEGDSTGSTPRQDGPPQIWCMDLQAGLIALGTAAGTVEFWHANTGQFKCVFDDSCRVGVTCLRLAGCRVVLARLTGAMEVLSLEWSWQQQDQPANSYSRRQGVGHSRCQSAGRVEEAKAKGSLELRVLRISTVRAHQQPLTALTVEAGRILTASHDHTLKVFGLVDQILVFTLHGHCGPVTHCFIDSQNPLTAGSASQDGVVCVWDLLTGACVFSVEGHDGAVTALTYSASYVISLGSDDKLCVWDRFQGHLLNTIPLSHAYCMTMVMLSHNLLVTSKMGSLVIWDVRWGEAVRCIKLGDFDECDFVRLIVATGEGVVCDYGRQLRLVRFPIVYSQDKID